jgi:hypothetical protein
MTARDARAGLGGIVFAVCSVVGGAVLPKPPAPDASAATVHHYFAAHHDALLAGSTLAALAAVALLPFLAALRVRLAPSPTAADSAFAAGTALVGCATLGALLQAGLAHVATRLDGSSVLVGYGLERMVFYVAPPFLVLVLTAAVASAGEMPGWLRGFSGVLSVIALVAAVSGLLAGTSAGTALGLVGFGLTIVWTVCTAAVLLRNPTAEPARRHVGALA